MSRDPTDDDGEEGLGVREADVPLLVGQAGGGTHVYYDEAGNTTFEGPRPEDRAEGERVDETPLDGDGVEGIVDAVREREGWRWLSEFAEEHLPGDDGDAEGGDGPAGGGESPPRD